MANYTSKKRVERDGFLIATEGEEMSLEEAKARGLLDEPKAAEAEAKAAPDRDALKARAVELGLEFPGNISNAKLAAMIAEAEAKAAPHKLGAHAEVDGVALRYDETAEQWIVAETGDPFDGEVSDSDIVEDE